MILVTDDVGEQHPLLFRLLDEADRNARHGIRDRHACRHQPQRGTADRRHRTRTIRLEDVGDHADGVGKDVRIRQHRLDAPLGQCAVADLTPTRAANRPHLADRVGREVVVEHELLRILVDEAVHPLLILACAERDGDEGLSLATLEERRAVHPRQEVDIAMDRTERRVVAAVRPLAVEDVLANGLLLKGMPDVGEVGVAEAARVAGLRRRRRLGRSDLGLGPLPQGLDGLSTLLLAGEGLGTPELREVATGQPVTQAGVVSEHIFLLGLARLADELFLHLADRADVAVGLLQRLQHAVLGHLAGKAFDHEHGRGAAGNNEIEIAFLELVLRGERNELAIHLRNPHAAQRAAEGKWRDTQRRRCTHHAEDVGVVLTVAGEHLCLNLHFVEKTIGKQRANGAVHEPAGERLLHRGTALTLEKAPGKLAGGGHALAVVAGQRKEVDAEAGRAGGSRHEHPRIAIADEHAASGLLCQKTRLDKENLIADLPFNALLHDCFLFLLFLLVLSSVGLVFGWSCARAAPRNDSRGNGPRTGPYFKHRSSRFWIDDGRPHHQTPLQITPSHDGPIRSPGQGIAWERTSSINATRRRATGRTPTCESPTAE